MKRINFKIFVLLLCFMIFSCTKQEKKPFGAENINYEDIEKYGNQGPIIESEHKENAAPFSSMITTTEVGPMSSVDPNISKVPIADQESDPDYGGIPIVIKETPRDIESETNES